MSLPDRSGLPCAHKRHVFKTRAKAERFIKRASYMNTVSGARFNTSMRAYQCTWCGAFHLTSAPNRSRPGKRRFA